MTIPCICQKCNSLQDIDEKSIPQDLKLREAFKYLCPTCKTLGRFIKRDDLYCFFCLNKGLKVKITRDYKTKLIYCPQCNFLRDGSYRRCPRCKYLNMNLNDPVCSNCGYRMYPGKKGRGLHYRRWFQ